MMPLEREKQEPFSASAPNLFVSATPVDLSPIDGPEF
jgi:hypothetical protein